MWKIMAIVCTDIWSRGDKKGENLNTCMGSVTTTEQKRITNN